MLLAPQFGFARGDLTLLLSLVDFVSHNNEWKILRVLWLSVCDEPFLPRIKVIKRLRIRDVKD